MISKPHSFVFKSYKVDTEKKSITLIYEFVFDGGRVLPFSTTVHLPFPIEAHLQNDLLDTILHSLHIMLGISYYKMYCPKDIIIDTKPLSKDQAKFWNTVYTKGLGEFFYKNEIDFRELIQFPYEDHVFYHPKKFSRKNRSLVGIAGGKDSIVSVELLKKAKKELTGVVFETNHSYPLINELIPRLDIPHISVRQIIDEKLNSLNKTGLVYNGHIPISAVYAFLGILTAYLYDYSFFIASNERSADEGNIDYHGLFINHQWSKSLEFEHLFSEYIHTFITPSITYFSLLRPLSELKIVQIFSQYDTYFSYFSSCNKNFKIFGADLGSKDKSKKPQKWCGACPKCAFMYLLLSAVLPEGVTKQIFGKNLFENEKLIPLFEELSGLTGYKPFDCVGTQEEVWVAFWMILSKIPNSDSVVLRILKNKFMFDDKHMQKLSQHVFETGSLNTIPESFRCLL